MYLDGRRPARACSSLRDTGPAHFCTTFAAPDAAACPGFDNYKYGLTDLSDVSATNLYLTAYANNATVLAQAVAAYPLRDVRYLLGEYDTCNCNTAGYANPHGYCYPAATAAACSPNADGGSLSGRGCCDTYPDSNTSNALAVGCEALLQGSNRLQRGRNYLSYLQS